MLEGYINIKSELTGIDPAVAPGTHPAGTTLLWQRRSAGLPKVLSLLLVPHVTIDEVIDQVKMLLREQLTLLFLCHWCRLHGGTPHKASSYDRLQPNSKTYSAKVDAENDSRDDSEVDTHTVPVVDSANSQTEAGHFFDT
jgi:hypothetical protein